MTDGQPRVQRARLGAELRRLRLLAGLSGREVARRLGIGHASVSRIENAQQVPSLPEVNAWADAVGATSETRALLTTLVEAALNEVETWRSRLRAGLPGMQADVRQLEATAATLRKVLPTIVPGLLQTAEYARRVFELVDVLGDSDYAAAVAERMQRQQILYDPAHQFEFLITEAALRWRPGPPRLLAAQLDHIRSASTLDNVTLGLIPADAQMRAVPWCGFTLYEDRADDQTPFVAMETAHAGLIVSDPADVAIYRKQLELLRESCVFGDEARDMLTRIAHEQRHAQP
ncbi:MAG: helix-turn-helix domain-containing protein [Pseudonocardiaceae bacterium]